MERPRTDLYCQHYGKSLSVDHWEETCDYDVRHFPFETYGRKWLIEKVRQSIPGLILCDHCMNGVKRFLPTRSRFDLPRLVAHLLTVFAVLHFLIELSILDSSTN